MKHFSEKRIYTIATAHLDTCWLWDLEKTIDVLLPETLRQNFALFEKYPEYTFNFEGSYRYELIEEYYPALFEQLKAYIAAGRWVPAGSCYENGDVNVPSPEALFRNILYGNGYFRERFDKPSRDIFLPDCFGFGWALPSIAAHAGLNGFSTGKLAWGSAYGIPFALGRWQGVDGNEIYANLNPGAYTSALLNARTNKKALKNFAGSAVHGLPFAALYHGTGDRGGAPAPASVKGVAKAIRKNGREEVKVLSAASYQVFDDMEALLSDEQKAKLPLWNNELLMTTHGTGSYTSRAVGKRWNRRAEQLADMAERMGTAAALCGVKPYRGENYTQAWKRVIAHHFHDDITGTSFQHCYNRSWNDYMLSILQLAEEYRSSCAALSSLMDSSFAQGTPVVVSNTQQCTAPRTEIVTAKINWSRPEAHVRVVDASGKEVPSQVLEVNEKELTAAFEASVPSVGLTAYDIRPADAPCAAPSCMRVSKQELENEYLRVKIDENGDICSIFDKTNNRDALQAPIRLALLGNIHSKSWPAWEVAYEDITKPPYAYAAQPKIEIAACGPARVALHITQHAGDSVFRQLVALDRGSRLLRVAYEVDWRSPASLLKVVFPLGVQNPKAVYDLGLGVIARGNNTQALYEVPAQQWADITAQDQSFGVSVLSDSRCGWDKPDDHTLRLTAIHTPENNYRWECSQHLMDLGLNRFSIGILPHAGSWQNTPQAAAEFHQPLCAFETQAHEGIRNDFSLCAIDAPSVQIKAIKQAERGDGFILRVHETQGKAHEAVRLQFGSGIAQAIECGADEEHKAPAQIEGGELIFAINAFEPKTFLITPEKSDVQAASRAAAALPLPYNVNAITRNEERAAASTKDKCSIPRELMPERISGGGTEFAVSESGTYNALACNGQVIELPGDAVQLEFLACALSDHDKTALLRVGDAEQKITIHSCSESVGTWDLISMGQTGHIKQAVPAFAATHTHSPAGDVTAKQFYVFKYCIDLPCGTKHLTLPSDEEIVMFSAVTYSSAVHFLAATQLFDTLAPRPFDYALTKRENQLARPTKAEAWLSRRFDRTRPIWLHSRKGSTAQSLGDLFYLLRMVLRR